MAPTSSSPPSRRDYGASPSLVAVSSPILSGLGDFYVHDAKPDEIRGPPNTVLEKVDAMVVRGNRFFAGIDFDGSKMACANAPMLLFDKSRGEAKNELLARTLPALLFRGDYRAHYEDTAYAYAHGSWNRVSSLSYVALEFATTSIRAAEGCFRIMDAEDTPDRGEIGDIASRLRRILGSRDAPTILTHAPARPVVSPNWIQEAIKLCSAMFRNFADAGRCRIVLANFPNGRLTPCRPIRKV